MRCNEGEMKSKKQQDVIKFKQKHCLSRCFVFNPTDSHIYTKCSFRWSCTFLSLTLKEAK